MAAKLKDYQVENNQIKLVYESQIYFIKIIEAGVIQLFEADYKDYNSFAVEDNNFNSAELDFEVENKKGKLIITTAELIIEIKNDFKVDFYDLDHNPISKDYSKKRDPFIRRKSSNIAEEEGHKLQEELKNQPVEVLKEITAEEKFYGLGDRTGHLNKKGYSYQLWNTDDPSPHVESFEVLYKSIPFILGLKGDYAYGLFFDNTFRSYFDFGKENDDYFYYAAEGGSLNYYFINGPSAKKVIDSYTKLTGKTPLPQKWTLGNQQSRWSYHSRERVEEIADNFRKKDIPCDVIYLDIDYMDDYKVFTWDDNKFKNMKEMIENLHQKGFKVVTIIDPGVKKEKGYQVYDQCLENGFYLTDQDGIPYVNEVWPGECIFPDFINSDCRAWWGNNHQKLLEIGIDGIWNDMNEPASFNGPLPEDVRFDNDGQKMEHKEAHNIYGHLMSKSTYEGINKVSNKRPFVITRASYAGTQKYSTFWTGDNHSLWQHLRMALPMLMNMGLSGLSFSGTDIGGFGSDATAELLTRWYQASIFTPLFRNHSSIGSRDQEPWAFKQEVEEISKKYIKLRYKFIPYLYDLLWQGKKTGLPVMRPLFLHNQSDSNTYNLNDQFLAGENILMAPVVQQGQKYRKVYLPDGKWLDYWTGEEHQGNNYILKESPLDTLPMYIKKGSIIPNYEVQNYIGEKKMDELKLKIYPGEGDYLHYQDDGQSFAYREGEFNLYKFIQEENDQSYEVTLDLKKQRYDELYSSFKIEFFNTKIDEVRVDTQKIDFEKGSQSILFNIDGDFSKVELIKA
ncbi:alpha-glucosidase [Halanaerobium saccharolyticum]|uniref:Alpha-glucosidase n=1 Tax=Halanaerobium saccharolyticum TaxID=43595 RepID=A0A4R6LL16_9FIRM|nr:glycoside hydrolase family 31 protein [Halanaerobium saccharolyticum]TDO85908.1 alpha-glucosidase [Halanaerobium saccharolyticum]